MPAETAQAFAVVLHDVTPESWPRYERFIVDLDAIGGIPLTLLVVPDFHRRAPLDLHPRFRAAIETRLARGDEVALHGYHHCDDAPLGLHPLAFLRRRVYTHEGEFAALDAGEARRRMERGLALFTAFGWPVSGFVAPAWLLNGAARAALTDLPFRYTSNPAGLIRLPQWRPLPAPSLVWSARSAWRRGLSRPWNEWRLRAGAKCGLIRLGVHPIDLEHAGVRDFWLRTIRELRATRRAFTKRQWLKHAA